METIFFDKITWNEAIKETDSEILNDKDMHLFILNYMKHYDTHEKQLLCFRHFYTVYKNRESYKDMVGGENLWLTTVHGTKLYQMLRF